MDKVRLQRAVDLFNSQDWYLAHDEFEDIWHETSNPERITIQGLLQIAVAELHLSRSNNKGATILYGEALGRLKTVGIPDLGFDIQELCECIQIRLALLQTNSDLSNTCQPKIKKHKI